MTIEFQLVVLFPIIVLTFWMTVYILYLREFAGSFTFLVLELRAAIWGERG
jgi:hypothetical protein